METPIQLIEMPEDSMRHILERCDFVSIQRLRKTCHTFRNFIDEIKPVQNMRDLQIFGNSKRILLIFFGNNNHDLDPTGGKIELDYKDLGDGSTKITWYRKDGNREKIIENNNILNAFSRDFGTILGCRQSKWDKITLRCDANVLKKIQENLMFLMVPLKVHTLSISSTACQQLVMEILKSLCSDTLTHLHLTSAYVSEIVKLEQWKKAKELDMKRVTVLADIESYFHFETAEIRFEKVTIDDLCKLKELFLHAPSITKRFELYGASFPDENLLVETLGEPYLILVDGVKSWYFQRLDNLVVCMYSMVAYFTFSVTTKDDVPKDTSIL